MNIELKTTATDLPNIFIRHFITLFWNHLKRGFEIIRLINVHQLGGEITAGLGFHIMGQYVATWRAVRPKPDKRDFFYSARFHREPQKCLMECIHRTVYRPIRERSVRPIAKINSLHLAPDRIGKNISYEIVGAAFPTRRNDLFAP